METNKKELFDVAIRAGEILSESGAETYRIEETMERLLQLTNSSMVHVFVTMTGFSVSMEDENGNGFTTVRRVRERTIQLKKIDEVNSISRQLCNGEIDLSTAKEKLKQVRKEEYLGKVILTNVLICASCAILFTGGIKEVIISAAIGIAMGGILVLTEKKKIHFFLKIFLSAFLVAFVAKFFVVFLLPQLSYETVIIASIMPLVPGVAITNAVLDIFHEDYMSGIGKAVEAFMISSAVALGIGSGIAVVRGFQWWIG